MHEYPVSGTVTFQGEPVPLGEISFHPDTTQGNGGPGVVTTIADGHYATPKGTGTVGGPHVVTIRGTDGVAFEVDGVPIPEGKRLFEEHQTTIHLPKSALTADFDVPTNR